MSGLREEPITLDDDDDSQSMKNMQIMPSTSGTQKQLSSQEDREEQTSDSDEESEVYVVEAIRAKRYNKAEGRDEYLIKWLKYPEKDNSWEPIENLQCHLLLQEFEEKEASKRKRRKAVDSPKPQSAKRSRRGASSIDGSESTYLGEDDEEKLFLEDDDDDDEDVQRSRKDRTNKDDIEPVGVKGFARGLPIESIINGVFGDDHKLFFFVKWLGEERLEMVSAEELKKHEAVMLCNWYEKRLFYKNGLEPETGSNSP